MSGATTTTELTAEQLDTVFATGDARTCWCMFDRIGNAEFRSRPAEELRDEFLQIVEGDGPAPGVVALVDGEPAGWVSVAPREEFQRVFRSEVMGRGLPAEREVWSVTCFVVRPGHRRRGLGATLLGAAVEHAFANGAEIVEGYPRELLPGVRRSSSDLYRGTLSMFLDAGFVVAERTRPGRAVVRLVRP